MVGTTILIVEWIVSQSTVQEREEVESKGGGCTAGETASQYRVGSH